DVKDPAGKIAADGELAGPRAFDVHVPRDSKLTAIQRADSVQALDKQNSVVAAKRARNLGQLGRAQSGGALAIHYLNCLTQAEDAVCRGLIGHSVDGQDGWSQPAFQVL